MPDGENEPIKTSQTGEKEIKSKLTFKYFAVIGWTRLSSFTQLLPCVSKLIHLVCRREKKEKKTLPGFICRSRPECCLIKVNAVWRRSAVITFTAQRGSVWPPVDPVIIFIGALCNIQLHWSYDTDAKPKQPLTKSSLSLGTTCWILTTWDTTTTFIHLCFMFLSDQQSDFLFLSVWSWDSKWHRQSVRGGEKSTVCLSERQKYWFNFFTCTQSKKPPSDGHLWSKLTRHLPFSVFYLHRFLIIVTKGQSETFLFLLQVMKTCYRILGS